MDYNSIISAIGQTNGITGVTKNEKTTSGHDGTASFEALLGSAMNMIKETDSLSNAAEEAELQYMLGLNDNIHDLLIAQQKANITLQYTVAVKNAAVEAYNQIMQLQF